MFTIINFICAISHSTSISKLNNFTRLEPTLHLLGISFNINTAQELMQEKQGVATRLLYQLYVSLEKKKRVEIRRTMLEMMQPVASASLHKKELDNYSDVRGLFKCSVCMCMYMKYLHGVMGPLPLGNSMF